MGAVYLRGQLAEQPFRVVDDRAYGLGLADGKGGLLARMVMDVARGEAPLPAR